MTVPARARLARAAGRRLRVRGAERVVRAVFPPQPGFAGVVTAVDGTRYHVDTASYLEWYVFVHGGYESRLRQLMTERVRPGDHVLDCGANVGLHTCALARRVGPLGRVVAVEPVDELAERLERNAELNGLANVEVVRAGVSSEAGRARMFVPPPGATNQGEASLHDRGNGGIERDIAVTTVDTLVDERRLDRLRLVKVDVEGHEVAVLRGARTTLRGLRPVVVFEYDPEAWRAAGARWDAAAAALREHRYRADALTERQPRAPVPQAGPAAQCMVVATPS